MKPRIISMKTLRLKVRFGAGLLLCVLICGCRWTKPTASPLNAAGHDYAELVLALGERDADSLDFAVVPDALRQEAHARYLTLDEIDRRADALRNHIEPLSREQGDAGARATFLLKQLVAMRTRTAMLRGHMLPFDREALALFDVDVLPDSSALRRAQIRSQVVAMLPATGASARMSPADRFATYEGRFVVPSDRLREVMEAAFAACRRQTLTYMTLPAGESVTLQFVRNQPWSAFSRYEGNAHSTISVNLDFPVDVDEALELACHEGYPGHHVFNTLRDAALVRQRGWPEAQVQPTFSPQSYLSEAAAAFAPRLAFTEAERAQVEREVLFPLAGLPAEEADRYVAINTLVRDLDTVEPAIARGYLDGNLEFVHAEERIRQEALIAHPEPMLLYLNEYRSYMLAYTDGPRRIQHFVQPTGMENRKAQWERYRTLMVGLIENLPEPIETGSGK
jgi:hypothetical protein